MQLMSAEQRGLIEIQLLKALEEALIQFQEATLPQRQAARVRYLQAIQDFTHFVSQYAISSNEEVLTGEIRQKVA